MNIKKLFLLLLLFFTSCTSVTMQQQAILLAEMQTPMGWNYLRIYQDSTFQFEERKLMKSSFYEGNVRIKANTLNFNYNGIVPDFGGEAIIDGIFLTYSQGIYNEVLEISLNKLSS